MSEEDGISPAADCFLGVVCLACFLVGIPGNILATFYFAKEHMNNQRNAKKLFFTELYLFMSSIDFLLTATVFPVFEQYFRERDGTLFKQNWFCYGWGFVWEILPYYSVFLLGVLSLSRMVVLVKPMMKLSLTALRVCVGCYALYHVAFRIVLWIIDSIDEDSGYKVFRYTQTTMYCFFYPFNFDLWELNGFHACVLLGLPLVPITISFITSLVKLRASVKSSTSHNFSHSAQNHATTTIIIVTVVYLACNLPVFVNYSIYAHAVMTDRRNGDEYYSTYTSLYGSPFMKSYIWSLTYVLSVSINATLNPIVFFWRMRPFRDFVRALLNASISGKLSKHKNGAVVGMHVKEVTTSSF